VTPFYASNYGPWIDVYAPGTDIDVLAYNNNAPNVYDSACMGGTSFATPNVTGTVSLMLAANPALSPAQAKAIIDSTTQFPGADDGYGTMIHLLDAGAAVQAAIDLAKEPPAQYVSLTAGNPGVPGDGIIIQLPPSSPAYFANPIALAGITNGLTITVFSSQLITRPPGQGFSLIADNPGASPGCYALVGFGDSDMLVWGPVPVNGFPAFFMNVSQSYLAPLLASFNYFKPGCNIQMKQLVLEGFFVWNGSNQFIDTFDAIAVGLGLANIPQ
jgi:hypothetical protein